MVRFLHHLNRNFSIDLNYPSAETLAVLLLWHFFSGHSPRRAGLKLRPVRVGFVVDKMSLGQVFSEYVALNLSVSFHQSSVTIRLTRIYIVLAIDGVVGEDVHKELLSCLALCPPWYVASCVIKVSIVLVNKYKSLEKVWRQFLMSLFSSESIIQRFCSWTFVTVMCQNLTKVTLHRNKVLLLLLLLLHHHYHYLLTYLLHGAGSFLRS